MDVNNGSIESNITQIFELNYYFEFLSDGTLSYLKNDRYSL